MKKQWQCIIIDDERLSRKELRRLLDNFNDIVIKGEAANIKEATEAIDLHNPDLIFLDIQLRNENGFDLLENINYCGDIIFVTAYNEFALRAFEVNALDYLQKPVRLERLKLSIDRLKEKESSRNTTNKILNRTLEANDLLFTQFGKHFKFLKISLITRLEAMGAYAKVYTIDHENGVINKGLKEWESRLPDNMFIRIHRSMIININYIEKVKKWSNFSYQVIMKDSPESLIVSRRYAKKLREQFS